jgi:hypothetical protein
MNEVGMHRWMDRRCDYIMPPFGVIKHGNARTPGFKPEPSQAEVMRLACALNNVDLMAGGHSKVKVVHCI